MAGPALQLLQGDPTTWGLPPADYTFVGVDEAGLLVFKQTDGTINTPILADITVPTLAGSTFIFNAATGRWENHRLTAGIGVSITNGNGSITISADGGANYQGTWNAATNTPTLVSSVGTKGFYYVVSVDGSTNLNGITDWKVGDWAIFNGTVWQKVDNTDAVTSISGTANEITASSPIGAVTLSLPTALTFTGKTVTGGTFASPTITTPTIATITAPALTPLTLNGGSSGASLVLGQGAAGALAATSASTTADLLTIKNTAAAGYSSLLIQNSAASGQFALGYGNASAAAPFTNSAYFYLFGNDLKFFKLGVTEIARLTNTGNLLIGGTTDITGAGGLKVFGTTAATNTTSGALQVAGGAGVAGSIFSGGLISSIGGANFQNNSGGTSTLVLQNLNASTGSGVAFLNHLGVLIGSAGANNANGNLQMIASGGSPSLQLGTAGTVNFTIAPSGAVTTTGSLTVNGAIATVTGTTEANLILNATSSTAGLRVWNIQSAGDAFKLRLLGDAFTPVLLTPLTISSTGAATFTGSITSTATGRNTFAGAISSTGSNPSAIASSAILDYSLGASRIISYGPNASTPGAFNFLGLSSDNSLGASRFQISTLGQAALAGTAFLATASWRTGALAIGPDGSDKVVVGALQSTTNGPTIGGHQTGLGGWAPINVNGSTVTLRIGESAALSINALSNVLVGASSTLNTAKLYAYGTLKVGGAANQATGTIILGDDQSDQANIGIYRGTTAMALGTGNWLNLAGYDGVNVTSGAGQFGAQTKAMALTSSSVSIPLTAAATNTTSGALQVVGGISSQNAIHAPTAAAGTNTTQLATTAFVNNAAAVVVNPRAPRQGLAFDGTAGGTFTLSSAFGTNPLTYSQALLPTQWAAQFLLNGGTNSLGISLNASGFIDISVPGVAVRLTTTATVPIGVVSVITVTRDSAGVWTAYLNGVACGTATTAIDNISSTSYYFGQSSIATSFVTGNLYGQPYLANRAFTAAEVLALVQEGAPRASDYNNASNSTLLNTAAFSSFAWGNGGLTYSSATATGFTASGTASGNGGYMSQPSLNVLPGQRFRIKYDLTSTGALPLIAAIGVGGNVTTSPYYSAVAGTNQVVEIVISSAGTGGIGFRVAGGSAYNFTVSNVSITSLGLLCAPDANQPGRGLVWQDVSGNNADLTLPASGVRWVLPSDTALTDVASVTAPATTNLALTAGSGGASLTLGQGTTAGNLKAVIPPTNTSPLFSFIGGPGTTNGATTRLAIGGGGFAGFESLAPGISAIQTGVTNFSHIAIDSYTGGSRNEVARFTNLGNVLIGGTTDITGTGGLKVFGTTAATNTTSGALQVAGGVGVAGSIWAGGAGVFGTANAAGSGVGSYGATPASGVFGFTAGSMTGTNMYGFTDQTATYTVNGAATEVIDYRAYATLALGANALTNWYGFQSTLSNKTGAGVLTNAYAFYASSPTAATNNYAFFSAGTAPSVLGGALTVSGLVSTPAATTTTAGLRVPHGAAPTSPVNGDIWTTTAGLFVRINGVTVGPLS